MSMMAKNSPHATSLLLYLMWAILIVPNCSQKTSAQQTCDPGWFGSNCQYKCRCLGLTCGRDGVCSDGVCWWGWFGPRCQFVDLVFTNSTQKTPRWIFDQNVTSCNQDQSLKHLTVKMLYEFPFTWLRLQVNDPSLLHEFQITFTERRHSSLVKCRNMRNATVNETTLDIHCDLDMVVQDVILIGNGVKSLCSLYVSGGRNVALRQNASQSSTYFNHHIGDNLDYSVASNAVDGKTEKKWAQKSCTIFSWTDMNSTWTLMLSSAQMINRYAVYYKIFNKKQTMGFVLTSFTKDLQLVINYTNTVPSALGVYTKINVLQTAPVSKVNIRTFHPYLSICEVELYGDSACPPSRYGRECEHTCNCAVKSESCFVSTGGCPSGCVAGFQGEGCDRICDFGKYGLDCSSNCSQFCVTTNSSRPPCRPTDGACVFGCVSGYQAPKCEHISLVVKGDDSIREAAFIGLAVNVVILIVLVVFLWMKYRTISHKKSPVVEHNNENKDLDRYEQIKHTEMEANNSHNRNEEKQSPTVSQYIVPKELTPNDITDSNSKENVYYIVLPELSSTSIPVKDLSCYMDSHDKLFFQHEFNSIPANPNATTITGMNEGNKHKNRYKNICAYDHSRVLLKTSSENKWGDYINASYIEGYRGQRKFIASQGPTKDTLEDFVRMLSEQDVQVVVMLTSLTEDGKVKCERYWPEDDVIQAGDIKVKLTTTQVFADYTIRRLQLSRDGDCVHELTQFHFTAWPDKDVPTTAWSLVNFEQRVASISTNKPIVVHCSAGVGRTGTFIALCNVLVEATETGCMDFFTAVQKLRHDRAYMVQTSVQYEFLHRAALVAVVCMGTTAISSNFTSRIKELSNSTDPGECLLDQEFSARCCIMDDGSGNCEDKETFGICDDDSGNCEDKETFGICDDGSGNCEDSATKGIWDDVNGNYDD